jgi:hypothetical protein
MDLREMGCDDGRWLIHVNTTNTHSGGQVEELTLRLVLQMVIFHVERHPNVTWYEQCVAFNMFPTKLHELTYRVLGMAMMYGLPLLMIIISYACIIAEIFRRYQLSLDGTLPCSASVSSHILFLALFIYCSVPAFLSWPLFTYKYIYLLIYNCLSYHLYTRARTHTHSKRANFSPYTPTVTSDIAKIQK